MKNKTKTTVKKVNKNSFLEPNELMANPSSLFITEIEYLNGEKGKMFMAIPKGISFFNVENGIKECLKRQPNVKAFSTDFFEKEGSFLEPTMSVKKIVLDDDNRLPKLKSIEYYNPKAGVTESVF